MPTTIDDLPDGKAVIGCSVDINGPGLGLLPDVHSSVSPAYVRYTTLLALQKEWQMGELPHLGAIRLHKLYSSQLRSSGWLLEPSLLSLIAHLSRLRLLHMLVWAEAAHTDCV